MGTMSPLQENPGSDFQSSHSREIQRRPLPGPQQGSARGVQGGPVPTSSSASEQGCPSFATQSNRPSTQLKYQFIPIVINPARTNGMYYQRQW